MGFIIVAECCLMLKTLPDLILYEGSLSIPHARYLIRPATFLYCISSTLLSYVFLLINSCFIWGRKPCKSIHWPQDCKWKSKAETPNTINNELHLASLCQQEPWKVMRVILQSAIVCLIWFCLLVAVFLYRHISVLL